MSNLSEKDFIHEGYRKHPGPFWFWMGVCLLITLAAWLFSMWVSQEKQVVYGSSPFLRVTNREFALFLWQNPEFMRQNLKRKQGYLEAWSDGLTVDPARADEWVEAPTEALFLYHTWNRLVGAYYYPRPIPKKEFIEFLKVDPEWLPRYWKQAPDAYRQLVKWLEEGHPFEDLKELNYQELPLVVRQAFEGWKNFTQEGEKINRLRPTYQQLWTFIDHYPNFRRPLWINLVRETTPDYLKDNDQKPPKELVAPGELDGLIKMALYNYLTGQSSLNPHVPVQASGLSLHAGLIN